jgi:hypothetical protein
MKKGIVTKMEISTYCGNPVLNLEIDRGRIWNSNGNSRHLRLIYHLKFPENISKFMQMLNRLISRLEEQREIILQGPSS